VRHAALLVLLALPSSALAGSTLRVMSWNLRHEGWSGERDYLGDAEQIWYEFGSSPTSPNGADIAFFQEVMDRSVPQAIADELTRMSGKKWTGLASPLLGRSSYKEAYGVVVRSDRVSVVSASVYNDVGDRFEREPWVVKVRDRSTGADYTFLDWHAVFGTTRQRAQEVRDIASVFSDVQAADPTDQDVILLGDHNAPATSTWWSTLLALAPAIAYRVNDPTTLNASGAWASAYDHVWAQPTYLTELSAAGRDYVQDPVFFVQQLSDHAPVWLKLYSRSDTD
jgi:endonuclease/exonuclease/phosphatase family metal-dependent hydrolase